MGNLSGCQTSGQFPIIHQFRITIFVDIYWGENDLFSATCLHQSLSIWYQMVSVGLSYQRLKLIEFGLKLLDARQNLRLSHAFNQSHFSFWDTHFVLHFWLAGTSSHGKRVLGSGGSSLNHQGMVQGKKKIQTYRSILKISQNGQIIVHSDWEPICRANTIIIVHLGNAVAILCFSHRMSVDGECYIKL